jgi:hypothetical protein
MGHIEPGHPTNPAAGAAVGAAGAAAPPAHTGDGGTPAPGCHAEAVESTLNWEAAWIDLGGEG